jgi:hypothetical protein
VAGYPHTLFARTGHPTDDPQPERVGRWECAERAFGAHVDDLRPLRLDQRAQLHWIDL